MLDSLITLHSYDKQVESGGKECRSVVQLDDGDIFIFEVNPKGGRG